MNNNDLYVICQNDYPIGVVKFEGNAIGSCIRLQEKYERLRKLADPREIYTGSCYFHYHPCCDGDSELFIENILLGMFYGWDEEYIKSLMKEM